MNVIVDADACPSIKLIAEVCQKYKVNLIIYSDVNHLIQSDYGTVYIVDQGYQNVDTHIINKIQINDIVVTQDYGLAALVLMKNAFAIHPKGLIYTNGNIDYLLLQRHIAIENRRQGNRERGPKKRTKQDNYKLIKNITKLILEKESDVL